MENTQIGKTLEMLDRVKGAQFARFTYRAKGTGELSRHILILNTDFRHAYERDVETLEALLPELDAKGGFYPLAAREILASLKESLAKGLGNNLAYVHGPHAADTYVHALGLNGVSIHKETGEIYVYGVTQDKTVIEPGVYPDVRSHPKTICKRSIDRQLRRGTIRMFSLGHLLGAAIAGETVDFTHARSI